MLELKSFKVKIEGKDVVRGIDLDISDGETHVIMGPNGSGKSTLAMALMGYPLYETGGTIILDKKNISNLSPDKRAREGMFLSFQHPKEIEGVTILNFLKTAYEKIHQKMGIADFLKLLDKKMLDLGMDPSFKDRYLNVGSGGERKRTEMLQIAVLNPRITILDEIDSGLDRDALEVVGKSIEGMKDGKKSFLIITHYPNILEYVDAQYVHIMNEGKIVKSGGKELIKQIAKEGYSDLVK